MFGTKNYYKLPTELLSRGFDYMYGMVGRSDMDGDRPAYDFRTFTTDFSENKPSNFGLWVQTPDVVRIQNFTDDGAEEVTIVRTSLEKLRGDKSWFLYATEDPRPIDINDALQLMDPGASQRTTEFLLRMASGDASRYFEIES